MESALDQWTHGRPGMPAHRNGAVDASFERFGRTMKGCPCSPRWPPQAAPTPRLATWPEQRQVEASAQGTLRAARDQDYCWMWSNKSGAPLPLRVNLAR